MGVYRSGLVIFYQSSYVQRRGIFSYVLQHLGAESLRRQQVRRLVLTDLVASLVNLMVRRWYPAKKTTAVKRTIVFVIFQKAVEKKRCIYLAANVSKCTCLFYKKVTYPKAVFCFDNVLSLFI